MADSAFRTLATAISKQMPPESIILNSIDHEQLGRYEQHLLMLLHSYECLKSNRSICHLQKCAYFRSFWIHIKTCEAKGETTCSEYRDCVIDKWLVSHWHSCAQHSTIKMASQLSCVLCVKPFQLGMLQAAVGSGFVSQLADPAVVRAFIMANTNKLGTGPKDNSYKNRFIPQIVVLYKCNAAVCALARASVCRKGYGDCDEECDFTKKLLDHYTYQPCQRAEYRGPMAETPKEGAGWEVPTVGEASGLEMDCLVCDLCRRVIRSHHEKCKDEACVSRTRPKILNSDARVEDKERDHARDLGGREWFNSMAARWMKETSPPRDCDWVPLSLVEDETDIKTMSWDKHYESIVMKVRKGSKTPIRELFREELELALRRRRLPTSVRRIDDKGFNIFCKNIQHQICELKDDEMLLKCAEIVHNYKVEEHKDEGNCARVGILSHSFTCYSANCKHLASTIYMRKCIHHMRTCKLKYELLEWPTSEFNKCCFTCLQIRFLYELHMNVCVGLVGDPKRCWLPGCSVGARLRRREYALDKYGKEDDAVMLSSYSDILYTKDTEPLAHSFTWSAVGAPLPSSHRSGPKLPENAGLSPNAVDTISVPKEVAYDQRESGHRGDGASTSSTGAKSNEKSKTSGKDSASSKDGARRKPPNPERNMDTATHVISGLSVVPHFLTSTADVVPELENHSLEGLQFLGTSTAGSANIPITCYQLDLENLPDPDKAAELFDPGRQAERKAWAHTLENITRRVGARRVALDRHEKDSRRIAEAKQADEELKSEGESYNKLTQLVQEMEKRREGDSWGKPIKHLLGGREKEEALEQRYVRSFLTAIDNLKAEERKALAALDGTKLTRGAAGARERFFKEKFPFIPSFLSSTIFHEDWPGGDDDTKAN